MHYYGNSAVISQSTSEIKVEIKNGLAFLSLPLPSRDERCQLTLRPITNTLADLIDQLHVEDKGIDFVAAYSFDGERIAKGTTIDMLLLKDFKLHINQKTYDIKVPEPAVERLTDQLDSTVKNSIVRLYQAIHAEQLYSEQERQLLTRLEHLRLEVAPMDKLKLDPE